LFKQTSKSKDPIRIREDTEEELAINTTIREDAEEELAINTTIREHGIKEEPIMPMLTTNNVEGMAGTMEGIGHVGQEIKVIIANYTSDVTT
jgi:hypothetical protein